jgi:hypothetical protein
VVIVDCKIFFTRLVDLPFQQIEFTALYGRQNRSFGWNACWRRAKNVNSTLGYQS